MDNGAAVITGVEKRHDEYEYLDLVRKVLSQGKVKRDRTGQSTLQTERRRDLGKGNPLVITILSCRVR
jgi:thymidylate synthase